MSTVSSAILMPAINFQATKELIKTKIKEYNADKSLGEKIRGHHFNDLWRLVEYFAFKIMEDNKKYPVSTRKINPKHPERILWTTKLSRDNMKDWFLVQSLNTVTRRLQRLAKAGFINVGKRGDNKKHLTSMLELNKDIVVLDDILNPNLKYHAKNSVKTRSNELKTDVNLVKNRFADYQAVNLSKTPTSTPLLNTTSNTHSNNKLMEKGVFSEKSEKSVSVFPNSKNSANPLPGTPNQGNFEERTKTNNQKYAEKINGAKPKAGKRNRFQEYKAKSPEENLEDYRRIKAEYVFAKSLTLWNGRTDVYEAEFRKAGVYVSENYFKDLNRTQIDSAVEKVLWCIRFQKNQEKTAKNEKREDQFVFYPYKYFSSHGVGSLKGIEGYYRRYVNGFSMSRVERAQKNVPYRKKEKNFKKEFVALKGFVANFLDGKRNLRSYSRFEALIKKKYPNKPQYIRQFAKMVRTEVVI